MAITNMSDFIQRKALEATEIDALERRIVTIPAKDWEKFEAWAHRPGQVNAGLKNLTSKPPTWQK